MKKSIAVMLIALLFLSSLTACDIGDFRFLEGSVFSSLENGCWVVSDYLEEKR